MEAEAKAPTKYTVVDAVDRFISERKNSGYAPKSVERYQYSLNRLTSFLTGKSVTRLRAVTADDLSDWKATWAAQTDLGKQKEQERLRTFFRWCLKRKYIDDDPADGLTKVQANAGGKRDKCADCRQQAADEYNRFAESIEPTVRKIQIMF